jgi:ATP synthase protein I
VNDEKWRDGVQRDRERLQKSERERRSLLGQTVYLGSLSVLFVVPLVGGAYLGHWLDNRGEGYAISWTMNLIMLGLAVGIFNVYQFIRKYW